MRRPAYLYFVIAILALLALLLWRFPYAVQSDDDRMRLIYLLVLLSIVAMGSWGYFAANISQNARNLGLWIAIFIVLVLGYSFRDRLTGELIPNRAQISRDGTFSVRRAEDGHFHIEALVSGTPVHFMVDTGASDIVLSPRDAERAGFDIVSLGYTRTYRTANGFVSGAPVRLKELEIGSIILRDIEASVNKADMGQSLLGMEFLNRLKSYRVEDNTLILVP